MAHPLIIALSQEESTRALIKIGFDYVIDQPLKTWVQPEEFLNRITRYFDLEQTGQLLEKHLPDVIKNVQETLQERGETVHDWLTSEMDAELRSWAMQAIYLNPRTLNRWVHHEVMEEIMRSLIHDILERFIQVAKPGGQGGGLLGMASRGAFSFANRASKGILGGISEQMEGHLKGLVAGFVQSSLHGILSQLVTIVTAPELAPKLGKARLKIYEDLLKTPLTDLMKQAQGLEMDEWSRILPEWVEYHLNRKEVRSLLINQIQNILDIEGHQPIRSFLGNQDRIESMYEEVVQTLQPRLNDFANHPTFAQWVSTYVDGSSINSSDKEDDLDQ